jgi:hypothetical protein
MDVEEEILIYGETEVWVTCDNCRRVYGGPGLGQVMFRLGESNVCVDCLQSCKSNWGTPAEGVGPSRPASR